MRSVGMHFLVISVFLGLSPGIAQPIGVDWKMYGSGNVGDGESVCFFEANSIDTNSNRNIKVWTKCLLKSNLDTIDIGKAYNGNILHITAKKILDLYIPPISKVEEVNYDEIMGVIIYEQEANIANIAPEANIFYELNCRDNMIRHLSLHFTLHSKHWDSEQPGAWAYIQPEGTNATRLSKILCSAG